jgi:hypothetical protein
MRTVELMQWLQCDRVQGLDEAVSAPQKTPLSLIWIEFKVDN